MAILLRTFNRYARKIKTRQNSGILPYLNFTRYNFCLIIANKNGVVNDFFIFSL
jgi:hypothetical protein